MRNITVGFGPDKYANFPILDDDAERLIKAGVLYECGDEHEGHDLHLDPMDEETGLWDSEEILMAIARAHAEWESDHTLPTQTLTMSATFPPEVVQALKNGDPEVFERRKAFTARNLALNLATNAAKGGMLEQSERHNDDGSVDLVASFTVVPPSKKGTFSAISRLYVVSLIQGLKGVSDQRKDDAISLIQMLK